MTDRIELDELPARMRLASEELARIGAAIRYYGGFGPFAEWGDMLGRGRNYIVCAPYSMVVPGLAITITVLAFNLLGDGIRDAFDPKSRKR